MTEREAALLLTLIPGVTPAHLKTIVAKCGGFSAYLNRDCHPPSPDIASPLKYFHEHRRVLEQRLVDTAAILREREIQVIPVTADIYPALLREIHDPPPVLYLKGDPDALGLPQLAIVGSRNASRWGLNQAERFAAALARSGFTITSGMALGVDGAAHRGALEAGRTVAVLGSGVDVIYPRRHSRLYQRILEQGGAIVSEVPPGSRPLRQHFPRRNRIISGLSMGVLIIEAAARSGSLITARLAMEQGREVFAVPGSIQNPLARGCHQLIREGAALTETLDDIVNQLGGFLALKAEELAPENPVELPETEPERQILAALGHERMEVDRLQQRLDMEVAQLTGALVNLEIQGYVENIGGIYQRIR